MTHKPAQAWMKANPDMTSIQADLRSLFLVWQDRGVNEVTALLVLLNVSARGLKLAATKSDIEGDRNELLESLLDQVRQQWNH
jgi:hypothetical protein